MRRGLRRLLGALRRRWQALRFRGSAAYWDERYRRGGTSGAGSYGRLARFKAEVVNSFVAGHGVRSVVEFGCGDGHQLSLADYPRYLGLDVSPAAIALSRQRFASDASKRFMLLDDYAGERATLALSLDVIYHLVEDEVYEAYMAQLFAAADRYVIVYASNSDDNVSLPGGPHVRHRAFTPWIAGRQPGWRLLAHIPNRYPYEAQNDETSFADFYIFERASAPEEERDGST